MAPTPKEWTLMVYLAGDNNLADAGLADLKEMKKVGSTADINVVAQFDNGLEQRTKRYFLQKGTSLTKDIVKDLGPTNTGDPKVLSDYVTWCFKKYPAKRYGLVLWNHGNGWDDEDIYRMATRDMKYAVARRGAAIRSGPKGTISVDHLRTVGSNKFRRSFFRTTVQRAIQDRGIAYDDTSRDFLDNVELKKLLLTVTKELRRKIDLLGMDACMMNMAEVLYQVRDSISVSVGSEEVEPGDGWPYDKVLEALAAKPKMGPQELGIAIVTQYIASYSQNSNVTQAACDLDKLVSLVGPTNAFANAMLKNLSAPTDKAAIVQARAQVQSYDTPDYIDLYDLCELIAASPASQAIKTCAQQVMKSIAEAGVVLKSGHKGTAVENSHGISIYFPQKKVSPLYATLDFVGKSKWDEFLDAYTKISRRPTGFRGPILGATA